MVKICQAGMLKNVLIVVDDVEIPVISEPVVAKSTPGRRKTA